MCVVFCDACVDWRHFLDCQQCLAVTSYQQHTHLVLAVMVLCTMLLHQHREHCRLVGSAMEQQQLVHVIKAKDANE